MSEDAVFLEYLGLSEKDTKNLENPFNTFYDDDLLKRIIKVMAEPDYFHFICKDVLNLNIAPFQMVILQQLWKHKFPMLVASRGFGKSFLLAVYSILVAILKPGSKIIFIGSGFRQSKFLFNYALGIWNNAPILRDISGQSSGPRLEADAWVLRIGESTITAVPVGPDGEKIRGLRSTCTIVDEMKSQNKQIFEEVIGGFSSVKARPIDAMMDAARIRLMKREGLYKEELEFKDVGNQTILSGTTYYTWNWTYEEWKRYKAIIESKGDESKLKDIFNGSIPEKFDWRDFCIMRIPYEKIPEGYMDATQVAKMKATINSSTYIIEYSTVYPNDSNGFFKRSIIESCVTNSPITMPDGEQVQFSAKLKNPNKKHVIAIDPASEKDNFAVVVLEVNQTHSKVVHCWTTTRSEQKERIKSGFVQEKDFFAYCARKIRDLEKRFPAERIVIDKLGGGVSILEAFQDPDKLLPGEEAFLPVIEEDKDKPTDHERGRHIVEVAIFANAEYISQINYGLQADLQDKRLLFPMYDHVALSEAALKDLEDKRDFDTLEECVLEIEELKDELSTIVMSQTASGRERWDTPEVKIENSKKGRMRKDRYSALVMANGSARKLNKNSSSVIISAGGLIETEDSIPTFSGPAWFTDQFLLNGYGVLNKRTNKVVIGQ